jgi:hypothetical protein
MCTFVKKCLAQALELGSHDRGWNSGDPGSANADAHNSTFLNLMAISPTMNESRQQHTGLQRVYWRILRN